MRISDWSSDVCSSDLLNLGESRLEDFLPLADRTETDRMVWMLPNLTCLTNIYARINLSRPDGLGGINLVHDDQLQYGRILADTKELRENLARQGNAPLATLAD